MHFLYNLSIQFLRAALWAASCFNPKAKKWVLGRRNWKTVLLQKLQVSAGQKTLWMHVSSLGEFEQGRPVIEQFRSEFPTWRIVLTFFSPYGYEVRKDYPLADVVAYLPADTPGNARNFLDLLQPDAAIFVKYDFWANYLFQLKKCNTPTLLVSALFRPSQPFFKWYGGLWREMLGCFNHIFVQNEASAALLHALLPAEKGESSRISVAGDTRVDRVLRLAAEVKPNPIVAAFAGKETVLVVGSSWEADENLLFSVLQMPAFQYFKVIIAPHEPSERNVTRICRQYGNALRYSNLATGDPVNARVLVIDNIGLLNTLYRYGSIAYIGGGLGNGIHNTLEPAAFGLPIIFGPKYEKFEEAREFVARGGAFSVQNSNDSAAVLAQLQQPETYDKASQAVRRFLTERGGATEKAMLWLRNQVHNQKIQG